MKHHGCVCDFTPQRNKELHQAYRRALASRSFINLREVCTIAANSPCSRFWVSEERATVVISALLKGQYALDAMSPQKREMFIEIFKRVQKQKEEDPSMSIYDAVFLAVNSPAPKFYMTTNTVVEIISRIRRGYYKKCNYRHGL